MARKHSMPIAQYRLKHFVCGGRVVLVSGVHADDDNKAIEAAKARVGAGCRMEVWRDDLVIARLEGNDRSDLPLADDGGADLTETADLA